jgi:hypothetical protein
VIGHDGLDHLFGREDTTRSSRAPTLTNMKTLLSFISDRYTNLKATTYFSVLARNLTERRIAPVVLARIPGWLAWLGLALSLLYLFRALGNASPAELDGIWVNGDTLYPVNVTTDVLSDGYPFSGWRFSIAPCWFPDLITPGLFWIFTHNAITATLLAGFIQLALIVGAFELMRRAIGVQSEAFQTVSLLGVSVLLTLYVATRPGMGYPDLYRFFIPQSHVGSLIMSLYALALGLRLLNKGSGATRAIYAGVCFAAGMSNLMFFPQMLAPITAAIALAVFFNVIPFSKSWAPLAIGWPFAIAGAAVNRFLLPTTSVGAQSQISREAALTALDTFMRGAVGHLFEPLHILAVLWLAACIAVIAVIMRKLAGQQAQQVSTTHRFLWVFCCCWVFSGLFSAGAVILGGSNGLTVLKDYIWTTHYLQAIYFIPPFGLPLLTVWLISQRIPPPVTRAIVWSGALLVIAIPAVYLSGSPPPKSQVTDYRPPLVQFLDDMASTRGLKYGVGGYWQSRTSTLLSHTGLRVYAIDPVMQPYLWVSNINWYTESLDNRDEKPPFRFVILDDPAAKLSRENAVQIFGQPSEEVSFQNIRVLIYSSPLALNQLLAVNEPLVNFNERLTSPMSSLQAKRGETIKLPVRIMNPTNEHWSSGGKYPVNLSYRWFEAERMLNIEGVRTLVPTVKPGEEVSLDAQVEVPKEGTDLTLKLSLVQEGVAWFFIRGAATLDIPVKVQ